MRIRVIDFTSSEPTLDTWLHDFDELKEWASNRTFFGRFEFADEKRHIITSYVLNVIRSWQDVEI